MFTQFLAEAAPAVFFNVPLKQAPTEARQWLKDQIKAGNKYAFASNKFSTTKSALVAVEKVYALGAEDVFVTGFAPRLEGEEPYCNTLLIHLDKPNYQLGEIVMALKPEEFSHEGNEIYRAWWD
jgi:hypothetical protein